MKRAAFLAAVLSLTSLTATAQPTFVEFESGPVRPVALSPNGSRLFVANIPDNRLEVFVVIAGRNADPRALDPGRAWSRWRWPRAATPRSGSSTTSPTASASSTSPRRRRASCARCSSATSRATSSSPARAAPAHSSRPPIAASSAPTPRSRGCPARATRSSRRPGVGRADVWVFDAANLGTTLGGTPLRILTLFADTPRALAGPRRHHGLHRRVPLRQPDDLAHRAAVCDGFATQCAAPCRAPRARASRRRCRDNTARRGGAGGRASSSSAIGANMGRLARPRPGTPSCRSACPITTYSRVERQHARERRDRLRSRRHDPVQHGVNPVTGAGLRHQHREPQHTRFEGPGVYGGSTVQGHLSEARITVLNPAPAASMPAAPEQAHQLLAAAHRSGREPRADQRTDPPAWRPRSSRWSRATAPRSTCAAFGSAKIGVFNAAAIEDPNFETNFDPATASANYIPYRRRPEPASRSTRPNNRLYVLTRFDNSVRVIDPTTKATLAELAAAQSRARVGGDGPAVPLRRAAHLGQRRGLVRELPHLRRLRQPGLGPRQPRRGRSTTNPQPAVVRGRRSTAPATFHPMKGPMTTQTLRGLATHGAHALARRPRERLLRHRPLQRPSRATRLQRGLVVPELHRRVRGAGRDSDGADLTADMQQFSDFSLQVVEPPNPVRALDNTLTAPRRSERSARTPCFNGAGTTRTSSRTCNGCHELNPCAGLLRHRRRAERSRAKRRHARSRTCATPTAKVGMFGCPASRGPATRCAASASCTTARSTRVNDFLGARVFNLTPTSRRSSSSSCCSLPDRPRADRRPAGDAHRAATAAS